MRESSGTVGDNQAGGEDELKERQVVEVRGQLGRSLAAAGGGELSPTEAL